MECSCLHLHLGAFGGSCDRQTAFSILEAVSQQFGCGGSEFLVLEQFGVDCL